VGAGATHDNRLAEGADDADAPALRPALEADPSIADGVVRIGRGEVVEDTQRIAGGATQDEIGARHPVEVLARPADRDIAVAASVPRFWFANLAGFVDPAGGPPPPPRGGEDVGVGVPPRPPPGGVGGRVRPRPAGVVGLTADAKRFPPAAPAIDREVARHIG